MPSRIFWFLVGGAAATWWTTRKSDGQPWCHRTPRDSIGDARTGTFGKQAAETVTELSEATLDTVISTVGALKAKLAEHRLQREQLRMPVGIEESKGELPRHG